MTRERAYSLRWLHVVGPATVFALLYAYYLGPILTAATGYVGFRFLDEWILGILIFWVGYSNASDYWAGVPGRPTEILGIDIDGMVHFGWGWMVLLALVVITVSIVVAGFILLRSLRDKELLPAQRQLGLPESIILALAWGTLALAVFCLGLAHLNLHDKFNWMFLDQANFNYVNPPMHLFILPFLMVYAGATAIIWFIRRHFDKRTSQFWRLEKVTLILIIACVAIFVWSSLHRGQGRWNSLQGFNNAEFLALLVLLWAWTCRVILLFNFARFKRESLLHPDSSCFACGYDLRGSRHSATCPECGVAVPVLVAAKNAGSSDQ